MGSKFLSSPSLKSTRLLIALWTLLIILRPSVVSANPVMLAPSSLLAFYVVVFWSFVVEAGVVALLLLLRGVAPLRAFVAYFVCNAIVFFLLFEPLLEGSKDPPLLLLELLVVGIDGLVIKLLVRLSSFQGDNYRGVSWCRSAIISGIGNGLSYFVGSIATQRPWESNLQHYFGEFLRSTGIC